jgi:glycosyltransferase involved in cell wall biosynthesis
MIAPQGGTELLYKNLIRHVGLFWQPHINLIISRFDPSMIDPHKKNILWQHLDVDQPAVQLMRDTELLAKLDHVVFVSAWQQQEYQKSFPLHVVPHSVMHNAIDPLEYNPRETDKIRLVYTSMPNRGLSELLDAFALVYDPSVELHVFSSTIIYGHIYAAQMRGVYDKLFDRCRTQPGVIYRGYALNRAVRKALQQSHVFSYPSVFRETSCVAAIEAGAAGCKLVTTDLGALTETCSGFADQTCYTDNRPQLVENFANSLQNALDMVRAGAHDGAQQSAWFNQNYGWAARAQQWKQLLGKICEK